MGRIKGWKKYPTTKIQPNIIKWHSDNATITVEYDEKLWDYQPPSGWYVWIHRSGSNPKRLREKPFKTKSQALNFAIAYMRKHPRG